MRKKLVILFTTALMHPLLFSQQSFALSDEEIQKSIQSILNVRHPQDSRQTWQSLGASAPRVIISLYQSSHSIYDKIRLIDGLAWFDDAATIEFLKKEAKENSNQVIQNSAIRSVALSQGMKEREFLSRSLASQSPIVRSETAKTLTRLHLPEADQLVKDYLGQEKDPAIVSKISRYRVRLQKDSLVKKKSPRPL
jgi:hypothetical protein